LTFDDTADVISFQFLKRLKSLSFVDAAFSTALDTAVERICETADYDGIRIFRSPAILKTPGRQISGRAAASAMRPER
jgi:hypothetical protein